MVNNNKNNKSQITIFVIIALLIVVSIAVIYFFIQRVTVINPEQNPQQYIQACIKESLIKTEAVLLEGNGYENVTNNFILFSLNKPGEKVPYLCKSSQYYTPCVNQEPLYAEKIRRAFEYQTKIDSGECFSNIKDILEGRGFTVTDNPANYSIIIEFTKNSVIANINRNFAIKREADSRTFNNFNSKISSPIYKLADTAKTIVNFESTYCDFNYVTWINANRDIFIKKFSASDQTKIYTIKDITSGKQIDIAIKSCTLPAGI